jgi:UDP-3-O-[3-hydroxymyristoyl] glucosamine N-acyltransferase
MDICRTAIIHPEAKIGENVSIGSYCVIEKCTIGNNCFIHPFVFIGDNVILADNLEVFHGAVIGKEPKGVGATSRPIEFDPQITIGMNTTISPHAVIYYDVHIGSYTLIGDGASIREQCRIGNNCIISRYVTLNYNVIIGNNVKIMDLSHITGNTTIEDNCFISALVGTANDNKITKGYGDHVVGQYLNEGAIIGLGANILPAIKIGKGAQIGAGALVTKDVPAHKLVKGLPARESLK